MGTGNTVSVTETVWTPPEANSEKIVIAPEYVPGASPPGLTQMLRLDGVVPLPGDTTSQLPPDVVAAEALKGKPTPLLLTETLTASGMTPPVW